MTSPKQDMGVVSADDDLVERIKLEHFPLSDSAHAREWIAAVLKAVDFASLSSELARCRNALGEKDDA